MPKREESVEKKSPAKKETKEEKKTPVTKKADEFKKAEKGEKKSPAPIEKEVIKKSAQFKKVEELIEEAGYSEDVTDIKEKIQDFVGETGKIPVVFVELKGGKESIKEILWTFHVSEKDYSDFMFTVVEEDIIAFYKIS